MQSSSNSKLGRMEQIDLRQVWSREVDFTAWLAQDENIEQLSEELELDLEVQSEEAAVGPFRADILCKEVNTDRLVIIENQIEDTDHSHLGQLLTYAAGRGASFVIWVARTFAEEHRAALDWLNENSSGKIGFFGVEVRLCRIADSPFAPQFRIVSRPNKWTERVQETRGGSNLTETEQLRVKYWAELVAFLKGTGSPLRCGEPTHRRWLRAQCPIGGFRCGFEIFVSDGSIDVYLGASKKENVELLRRVRKSQKQSFEKDLGTTTDWKDTQKRVWVYVSQEADPSDMRDWPRQHEWMKNTLENLVSVFTKYATNSPKQQRGREP